MEILVNSVLFGGCCLLCSCAMFFLFPYFLLCNTLLQFICGGLCCWGCFIPYHRIQPSSAPMILRIKAVILGYVFKIFSLEKIMKVQKGTDPVSEEDVTVSIEQIKVNEVDGSDDISIQVNVYKPPENKDGTKRIGLFFHAGAFIFGHPNEIDHVCKELFRQSEVPITIIAPNYRKCPSFGIDEIFHDARRSLAYLIENHAPDKNKELVIYGESEGGHLASYLANILRDGNYELYPKELVHIVCLYPHLTDHVLDAELETIMESRKTYKHGIITNDAFNTIVAKKLRYTDDSLAYSCLQKFDDLPSHYVVTIEHDYLKSEGRYLHEKIIESDGVSEHYEFPNEIHRFLVPETSMRKESWKELVVLITENVRNRFSGSLKVDSRNGKIEEEEEEEEEEVEILVEGDESNDMTELTVE